MELRWLICLSRCCEDDPFLQCCSRVKQSLDVRKCVRWEALKQARAVLTKLGNTSPESRRAADYSVLRQVQYIRNLITLTLRALHTTYG